MSAAPTISDAWEAFGAFFMRSDAWNVPEVTDETAQEVIGRVGAGIISEPVIPPGRMLLGHDAPDDKHASALLVALGAARGAYDKAAALAYAEHAGRLYESVTREAASGFYGEQKSRRGAGFWFGDEAELAARFATDSSTVVAVETARGKDDLLRLAYAFIALREYAAVLARFCAKRYETEPAPWLGAFVQALQQCAVLCDVIARAVHLHLQGRFGGKAQRARVVMVRP